MTVYKRTCVVERQRCTFLKCLVQQTYEQAIPNDAESEGLGRYILQNEETASTAQEAGGAEPHANTAAANVPVHKAGLVKSAEGLAGPPCKGEARSPVIGAGSRARKHEREDARSADHTQYSRHSAYVAQKAQHEASSQWTIRE